MDNSCAFADVECGKCKALRSPVCCERCSFHKTARELGDGRERAKHRIDSLPRWRREKIFNKYYRFNKPIKD